MTSVKFLSYLDRSMQLTFLGMLAVKCSFSRRSPCNTKIIDYDLRLASLGAFLDEGNKPITAVNLTLLFSSCLHLKQRPSEMDRASCLFVLLFLATGTLTLRTDREPKTSERTPRLCRSIL